MRSLFCELQIYLLRLLQRVARHSLAASLGLFALLHLVAAARARSVGVSATDKEKKIPRLARRLARDAEELKIKKPDAFFRPRRVGLVTHE